MKGIFKFMTAAAVSTAMVACTDDLSINSNADFQSDADLVGTLNDARPVFTRMGMSEGSIAPWDDPVNSNWGLVWTEGDEVRVFTLDQLKYNYYKLKDASANKPKGEFDIKTADSKLEGDKKFALTDAQFVYGVSATSDGEARLTYTIPYRWTAQSTKDADGVDVRKFPAPYWGRAEETSDGKINVGFSAMTAFLRVEMDKLPKGTKYVVLTTHGDPYKIADEAAGSPTAPVAATPDAITLADGEKAAAAFIEKVKNGTDLNADWAAETNKKSFDNGKAEPLSGTFNTLLKEGATLAPDKGDKYTDNISRLVTRDEIIVELDENTPSVFYVPVIAQKYENLHVIAAKAVSRYAYRYVGTELKSFSQEFERGHYYFLTINLMNLGEVSAAELNAAIKAVNTRADRTSILNIDKITNVAKPATDAEWTTYANAISARFGFTVTVADLKALPWDRIFVQGDGSLVLNIAAIDATAGAEAGVSPVRNDLSTMNNNALFVSDKKTGKESAAGAKVATNMVTINMPQQSEFANGELFTNLPTYNTTIGSVNGNDLTDYYVYALGSKTNCVTGMNLEISGELENKKDGAINLVTGLKELNVLEGTEGDLFINNIGEEPYISDKVNIQTTSKIDVRIDNSLVKSINFVDRDAFNMGHVFTTGSSAISTVYDATADASNHSVTVGTADPNNVKLHSYWTGAALSQKAITGGFDQKEVYTVAQLASMGEQRFGSTQAEYHVHGTLVNDMWLGAKDYLWVGPAATVAGFKFDGDNVALRKMSMQLELSAAKDNTAFYVDDPHLCCTSCGWKPAVYASTGAADAVKVWSFGLIRAYGTETTAATTCEIRNVNLSDVLLEDTGEGAIGVNHIGSIIGYVNGTSLTMEDNIVTNPKINVSGANIGGAAGNVKVTGDVNMTNNRIGEDGEEIGKVISTKGKVGGLVGNVETAAAVTLDKNTVTLSGDVQGAELIGGLAGNVTATGAVAFGSNKSNYDVVNVKNIKATTDSNVGGFAGNVETTSTSVPAIRFNFAEVTVPGEISAAKYYAGGIFGEAASGGVAGVIRHNSATVKVGTIAATEGFVGGETGYVAKGTANFGYVGNGHKTNIDVNLIKGAYAMGGLIGADATNVPVNVITKNNGSAANDASITIAIKDWNNTKSDGFAAFFGPSDTEAQRAGTISNVIGYMNGEVNITNAKDDDAKDLLIVTDYLNAAKKVAVGYKFHRDEHWTSITGPQFWGDTNGYVGYGKSVYKINGTPVLSQYDFNLFKSDANYSQTSKLPQGE